MVFDMTTGSSAKKILKFSIPLLIGTVFQQMYSMVDSIVVGQFAGTTAFAAVGATGSITLLVFGMVFGSCSGFAIPVAQEFGAGSESGVRRCVANIIWLGVIFTAVMTLLTTLLTKKILIWMGTQPEMLQDAYDYLFWIFLGLGAQLGYNMMSGVLRALGDSRTPLMFLILSCFLNVVLDIVLVKSMGVKGAAIATVVSQLVSALLCLAYIAKKHPILHLSKTEMKPDMVTIRRLLNIGIPMGLQFSIMSIGSIILQTSVNGLGVAAVASISAANRVNGLLASPMDAYGVAVATFAGQNFGARKISRIRRGMWQLYGMLVVYSAFACLLNWLGGQKVVLLFISAEETQVISMMHRYLVTMSLFYPLLAAIIVFRNALEGVGFSKHAMMVGVLEMFARTFMGAYLVPRWGYDAVIFSNPLAWTMANAVLIPMYVVLMRRLYNQYEGSGRVLSAK